MKLTIQENERFGPTIQGEGPDVGKPCFFFRLQGCPVHCPGCDTAYTWDGTERGKGVSFDDLTGWVASVSVSHPGCGLVVSGGEPLIHYGNPRFPAFVRDARRLLPWVSLETSGYVGPTRLGTGELRAFLSPFSSVSYSPKVTPCLRGPKVDYHDAAVNAEGIMAVFTARPRDLALKFVCRDEGDLAVVDQFVSEYAVKHRRHTVYVMPYGVERDEVLLTSERLIPLLAERGYTLTPRLHSLIWGKRRGV